MNIYVKHIYYNDNEVNMFVSTRHMLGVAGKQPNGSQSYLAVT